MKPTPLSISATAIALVAGATLVATAQTPLTDAQFVREASRMNQTEIAAAQAILKTTTDPRVRDFANTMIADHSKANVELRVAARKAGLTVPAYRTVALGGVTGPETPPPARTTSVGAPVDSGDLAHSGSMSASSAGKPPDGAQILSQASAAPQNGPQSYTNGDIAYLQDQVTAHQMSLKLMQNEAKNGQNPALKSYADDQSTTVSHHLDVASADLNNGASPAPSSAASPAGMPTGQGMGHGPQSGASSAP